MSCLGLHKAEFDMVKFGSNKLLILLGGQPSTGVSVGCGNIVTISFLRAKQG